MNYLIGTPQDLSRSSKNKESLLYSQAKGDYKAMRTVCNVVFSMGSQNRRMT